MAGKIVDQMFEHWDFAAQVKGVMNQDSRPPKTIQHLFSNKRYGKDEQKIRQNVKESEMAKFNEVSQFFYLYETTGSNMTHCSLMGASDMFSTTGKWHFPDAPEVQRQLFENIAWLSDRNLNMYISERQTPRFPFIEDFDIQCAVNWMPTPEGKERPDPPDDLIMLRPYRDDLGRVCGHPGELMDWRAKAVHMIYPHISELEVLVYSASGYNKGKALLKSSFHLVWPQIIVDPDRAPVIRYVTLGTFKQETHVRGTYLQKLNERLLELDPSNEWELVFDSTTINARNGLRLPYSDKASMVIKNEEDKIAVKKGDLSKNKAFKTRVIENRPSVAVGKILFKFEKDPATNKEILVSSQWTHDEKSMEKWEWIHQGSCRREHTAANPQELTAWQLGPDVLKQLPKTPGQKYNFEEGDDQNMATHRPYPNIRICQLDIATFQNKFSDSLTEEQDALEEELQEALRQSLFGAWISVTRDKALWRTAASLSCAVTDPSEHWGRGDGRVLRRQAEVLYLQKTGKIIIDGPRDIVAALIRAVSPWTEADDYDIMPVYDVEAISK
eukprot:TRINITY_DN14607_c0_g1_i1.p1 TRINITY_DN14607_c0_g1~~TRINITY_DN14607_c0_g1_i1.p1  ORF type:complete len:569 (-),score=96.13 TRINITY_DN14607_c0_g1_i1:112-1779(-)